jgi:membrane protein DedA with SNARE-associated domain
MFALLVPSMLAITYGTVNALISQYGYYAIFVMLVLVAAFPLPSEVVLPAVGYFAARGVINPYLGFASALLGGIVGMSIDYYIAYFLGKEVVYKHLHFFHIKKENLLAFDAWFMRNGPFAVFISRVIPLVRELMNFPAGFAEMPIRKFYLYSISGTIIWDVLLMAFGYYALSLRNLYAVAAAVVIFAVVLYLIYAYGMRRIRRGK